MRKALKTHLEGLFATVQSAHEEITHVLDNRNLDVACRLLEDCQNAAIQIGTIIEESEGDGTVTVELLEKYCEQIYQLHEQLQQESVNVHTSGNAGINARKVQKILQKQAVYIKNSIKHDIKIRMEVVFLPYKASMWDSLESVWIAADADSDCDAYVVPIPYYDKNADGTFGKLHDESGLYPNYVPVVSYKEYNFAVRRPDIIFIHNPYDGMNFVTSVPPAFYSENLKKYTECLVYIPYYVSPERTPGNKREMEHMTHFVLNPGVIHANYVIVQSEAMRQIYIDILTNHAGESTRSFWNRRVYGLGSPKTDKVMTAKEEDFEIPEQWKAHMHKENGNRRRVIFYNTSIGAFLQHEELMLEKIKDTLRIFRAAKEHVAILWRPHPLLPATVKAMRPQLYTEYKKIVEEYRSQDWGIYDDSANLNRAIAVSDAYYGDPSSVVQLFRKVRKPIMIQDVRIRTTI